ncbi:pentapeptide repeat-containing protein [uncultured Nostoc sp.]|uniref:pentapeptide repeat-containing protein n=1 Tax=uncultured Nostoc sp. TaxID=340711 RepID=UPI0035C9CB3B
MSDNKTDTPRNSFILLISFFVFALFIISSVMVAHFVWDISPLDERLKNETEALKTTATIFGVIAVFINAYYAAKRWEAMDKSAEAANKTAKAALQNAQAAQDKQITERFAKAIEQLGNEKIEVRLGAIYTLERIAKDSKDDHWTIMEVLTAFVRENAPVKKDKKKAEKAKLLIKSEEIEQKPKLKTDIQAALIVIGRRKSENDLENKRLDLRNIDIRGADLTEANLKKALFRGANLENVFLDKAELQEAIFIETNMTMADLRGAKLQEANLMQAKLQGAIFLHANLYKAELSATSLEGATFAGANLQDTKFIRAALKNAILQGAENLRQEQIEEAIGDRTTILPENLQPPKHWKA